MVIFVLRQFAICLYKRYLYALARLLIDSMEKCKTMNWIEIIEIRALHRTREKLETELQKILADVNKDSGGLDVKIYSRMNLDTDFVILIMNVSGRELNGESQLGIRLNEGLKDYGMVNYSIWNELSSSGQYTNEAKSVKSNIKSHENN